MVDSVGDKVFVTLPANCRAGNIKVGATLVDPGGLATGPIQTKCGTPLYSKILVPHLVPHLVPQSNAHRTPSGMRGHCYFTFD